MSLQTGVQGPITCTGQTQQRSVVPRMAAISQDMDIFRGYGLYVY